MKNYFLVAFIALFLLASCTAGPNSSEDVANAAGKIAGFWYGLWHGLISPITFVISLFSKNISFYEIHNNGGWYNFGFILGAGITLGGSGKASSRNR